MEIENAAVIKAASNSLQASHSVSISLPQDKSIFHRILFLSALSEGAVTIPITGKIGEDVQTTIDALRLLNVLIEQTDTALTIRGVGKQGLSKSNSPIDCRNSGTTARLLMGILSAQSFDSQLIGDTSLSKRPMKRLASVLHDSFGADITTTSEGTLPIVTRGKQLRSGNVALPVASAQMKSAALLAAYCANIETSITEPSQSRDHTEWMMRSFGIDLQIANSSIYLPSQRSLHLPNNYHVPGDISSAAFFVVAAAITRSDLRVENVGLNPTRTAYLDLLMDCGVPIWFENVRLIHGERIGTIIVQTSNIQGIQPFDISGSVIANLQDEIPALAVLALFMKGESQIADASELRKKESDRISVLTENLRRCGTIVRELGDGLMIEGSPDFIPTGFTVSHHNDHRIAMAMSLLGFRASAAVTIPDASVVSISFPSFFSELQKFQRATTIELQ